MNYKRAMGIVDDNYRTNLRHRMVVKHDLELFTLQKVTTVRTGCYTQYQVLGITKNSNNSG